MGVDAMFGAKGADVTSSPEGEEQQAVAMGYGTCAVAERVRVESSFRSRSNFVLEGARTGEQDGAVLL